MDTNCPCCGKFLYRTALVAPDVPVRQGGAHFQQDKEGPFVMCPSCGTRINLRQVPTPVGSPAQFELAPAQDCGHTYDVEVYDRMDMTRKAVHEIESSSFDDAMKKAAELYRLQNPGSRLEDLEVRVLPKK